ncbi:phenoloxidase-activating factor 3-like [Tribolium madens]|uniref:phenoloxidase-activating factor 3-like n=1 Tax=Tribolium madens TaxID=41895 RepID=UPI001CF748A7|nr:phenoloxidase-activating factor 3-like [Tribolium madens]
MKTSSFCVFLLSAFFTRARIQLNSCRSSRSGTCIDIWKCPYYVNLLNAKPRPPHLIPKMKQNLCGFVNRETPKVCCRNLDRDMIFGGDFLTTHENFHLLPMDNCGPISHSTRIMEGGVATRGEFPWMALIAYKTGDSPEDEDFKCGGSLINERYVLTAAHCLDEASILGIRLGEYDIQTEKDCDSRGQNCEPPVQDLLIDKIIIHSRYNPSTYSNDIGLIRLATPANFNYDNVKPICLPHGNLLKANLVGKFLTVTGWGVTETGHKSMILSKVSIPIVPLKECQKLYGKFKPISKGQICAGGYKGRDSCSGDSGGPLQYITSLGPTQRYVQEGIVSYGPSQCGINGRPAIYTDVKEYMSWILDTIEP